jgi:branched-chain amino acid transport system substrate-binding protein
MNRTRDWRLAAFLLAAVIVVAACTEDEPETTTSATEDTDEDASAALGSVNEATGTPVRVGIINTEGGSAISLPEAREAAEAAAEYANNHLGGLDGHPIELVTCAEQGDTASAADCGTKLVQDGVDAVVVTVSGQGDAIVPIVTDAGIPYVTSSGAAAAELTTPNVFLWAGGVVAVLGAWAQYSADNDIEKLAVLTIDVPTTSGAISAIAEPAFAKAGVELETLAIPPGTADMTPQVTAALAGDPGAIGILGDATFCQSALSALETSQATQPTFVISTCDGEAVREALPGVLEGKILFNSVILQDDDESDLFRAVMQTYAPDTDPTGITVVGYQSFLGLVRAVNAGGLTGDPTPESIAAAIAAAKDVPLPLGSGATFTCDGTAIPVLENICSGTILAAEIQGEDHYGPVSHIDPTPLFG